jgi:hypothetical protein
MFAQCLISNGDFKSSHTTKGPFLYPDNWNIRGKYIYMYDDRKPYLVKDINSGKKHQYTREIFNTTDTTKKEVLYMGYKIGMFGSKSNQMTSTRLSEVLLKDTLYEISMDVFFFAGGCFSYKYYPVFLSTNGKFSSKKIKEVQLFEQDKKEFKERGWRTIRAIYKSNGTELFFGLKTDFDYSKVLKVYDLKKAKDENIYGASIYFDNICIKKIASP